MMSAMLRGIFEKLGKSSGFTVSIAGLNKNSGKTVTLLYVLEQLKPYDIPVAVTTIGYDGERSDFIFGHAKPQVVLPPGSYFATAAGMLNTIRGQYALLDSVPEYGPFGQIYLGRATDEIQVELVGPSSLRGLLAVRDALHIYTPYLIVDGAFNRIAQLAPDLGSDIIIACGGTERNDTLMRLTHLKLLLNLPETEIRTPDLELAVLEGDSWQNISQPELAKLQNKTIFYRGALIDQLAQGFISLQQHLIIPDMTRVFLSNSILKQMTENGSLSVVKKSNLLFITYNPRNFSGKDYDSIALGKEISRIFPEVPCCDLLLHQCFVGGRRNAATK